MPSQTNLHERLAEYIQQSNVNTRLPVGNGSEAAVGLIESAYTYLN